MPPPSPDGLLRPAAHLELFGYEPTPATLVLRPRSRRWRLAGAGRILVATAVAAPAAALVPPHAPWVIGALVGGGILARRRWRHRFSVVELRGACPRCGSPVSLKEGTRLRSPHPVGCDACGHQPSLRLDADPLSGA